MAEWQETGSEPKINKNRESGWKRRSSAHHILLMCTFAPLPQFDENSSHDSGAECQRAGKAMFSSSRTEGAVGVRISHVTGRCDSFPARWH